MCRLTNHSANHICIGAFEIVSALVTRAHADTLPTKFHPFYVDPTTHDCRRMADVLLAQDSMEPELVAYRHTNRKSFADLSVPAFRRFSLLS